MKGGSKRDNYHKPTSARDKGSLSFPFSSKNDRISKTSLKEKQRTWPFIFSTYEQGDAPSLPILRNAWRQKLRVNDKARREKGEGRIVRRAEYFSIKFAIAIMREKQREFWTLKGSQLLFIN